MKYRHIFSVLSCTALLISSCAEDDSLTSDVPIQAPDTLWTKIFGESGASDLANSVQQTSDGGYILAGYTGSYGDASTNAWLIKTDGDGNQQWDYTYGGANSCRAYCVQQTSDGGYVFAGMIYTGVAPNTDIWLIKTDGSGVVEWDKTFDAMDIDEGYCVQQTSDGGYVLTGFYKNWNCPATLWLIKTDEAGDSLWSRSYGGAVGRSIRETADGGYAIAGNISPYGYEGSDVFLLRTDEGGDSLWTRRYAVEVGNLANCLQNTLDGGFIMAGSTTDSEFYNNIYLIKTDAEGNELWHRIFDRSEADWGYGVQQTSNGGYIIVGTTAKTSYDIWVIKTDALGYKQWDRIINGRGSEYGYSIQQTTDGGYIIAGYTTALGEIYGDAWLVRLEAE